MSTKQDLEHLRLLSIFHYILAGITALVSCIPFLHLAIGIILLSSPQERGDMPVAFAWMFILVPAVLIVGGWVVAFLLFVAGRCLDRQIHRLFCLVTAGISCLFMPLGTVLGVFTIIVLMRESVQELFEKPAESRY